MLRHLLFLLLATALSAQTQAGSPPAPPAGDLDPARAFFAKGDIVRFDLALGQAERQHLRDKPREYVPCALKVDGKPTWQKAGVKLKGAAGSFREIDDRPGFTVHVGKFGETTRFHGLQRFHLNNSAQDGSHLCEWLGHEVFTAAGRPAPRVSHAHVTLDGEDLGLYVLREAFDSQFLLRVFGNTNGNLYDGGFCQDIDSKLEKDSGNGPDDHSDLHRILALCRNFDPERVARLEQAVDIDAFVDFCALEAMLCHWDGYTQNRNNFRVWLATAPARTVFLPHGMDQLLGDTEASILRHPPALAAGALMQHPAWRSRYRERCKQLLPLFSPRKLVPRVRSVASRLRQEMQSIRVQAALDFDGEVRGLIDRIEARYLNLQDQVKAPEPKPQQFPDGKPLALRAWHPAAETEEILLGKKGLSGGPCLQIAVKSRGSEARQGAWRTTLLLGKGRYRLCGAARCDQVEGPPPGDDGKPTGGARLAVDDARSARLFGNQVWQDLVCEFTVAEFQRDVELRLDLRAMAGKAWFRLDSLQLQKLPD